MQIFGPFIDVRYREADPETNPRKKAALIICDFLEKDPEKIDESLRKDFYIELGRLLQDPESERILLYIPFGVLKDAPKDFRKIYMDAWYRLLRVQDVRENFFEGDCLELDARPEEGLERVVKCVHLLPWLVEYQYISLDEVRDICMENLNDGILMRSFSDSFNTIWWNNSLTSRSHSQSQSICDYIQPYVPARKRLQPLYISEKRLKWLNERRNAPSELLTPEVNLADPFSDCIDILMPKLNEIAKELKEKETVLVGGSQLKGYGTVDSDLDIWELDKMPSDNTFCPGSFHSSSILLGSVWVSNQDNLEKQARWVIYSTYGGVRIKDFRRHWIERLESDLLQYRLLHKGFARFTKRTDFKMRGGESIDGNCPFYDDEYRKIATMLYAKYVWI